MVEVGEAVTTKWSAVAQTAAFKDTIFEVNIQISAIAEIIFLIKFLFKNKLVHSILLQNPISCKCICFTIIFCIF
ncbi:TPA: hypothetical protein DEG21_03370 [Patescibacteria group bacterium]|nr:hypothetical protein [Candidatus Gracilibacteria bacterium]HBY74898.1 hypothetical protein [Candidatus Gracilibacteria bacterium]